MNDTTELPRPHAEKLEEFTGKVLGDIGGAFAVLLSYIGDQTSVYRTLRDHGPATSDELAEAAGVDERYLREWLSAQAAGGYVTYHPAEERFSLTPEQATVLAQEGHPACLQGLFQQVVAQFTTHEEAVDVLRTGAGRPWSQHHGCCFTGTDRFFRPGYVANLVSSWLPALDGVVEKLERGARVADVGCGHGSSTVLLAQAFPASVVHGYDFHGPSIEAALEKASDGGVADNTRFETAEVKRITERDYDLVCMFDALHDLGDPVGAATHIRDCLAPDGTFLLVEPLAGDRLADNTHLLGQIYYSASTLICTPASRAQDVGLALGAQAGEKRLSEVLHQAGFTRVRRAAETETNMVLEARP
ncbi:class I SAM-dependent methyltransferase [Thiohalorhabdus sp. Cl-TMA]|uniref:Class I SAM-dependent methyltransferase n=1 Tax=Thiohalorhabdus methylotrophus TaxID=3242694 RepID=A0ABV4U0X2_9GAMM